MSKPSSALIEHIYRMAGVYTDTTSSDAELIQRYAEMRDERAFSTLMVRHGLMVWSICQRILHNPQDAEEAYQTTFLALAHKVKNVRGENLVGWLHHVAQQTAGAFRRKALSRDKIQKGLQSVGQKDMAPETNEDLYGELHSEIARLPEKVRAALVLHYLEGKTQVEVGHILGVTEAAVRDRLNRGRLTLEKRLCERGLTLGAATLGSLLAEAASNATMHPSLVSKTVKAATAFRNGKLTGGIAELARQVAQRAPSITPWWMKGWIIALVCASGLGLGAGGIAWKTEFFCAKTAGSSEAVKAESKRRRSTTEEPKPSRVDVYGDPLPEGALARLGTIRLRVTTANSFLQSSPDVHFTSDSKRLVTAGQGKGCRIWDLATGRLLRCFEKRAASMAMSSNGRTLAVAGSAEDGVGLWDLNAGKLLRRIHLGTKVDKDGRIQSTISPDGNLVVLKITYRGSPFLYSWDVSAGKLLWEKPASECQSHSFSFDGKVVIWNDRTEFHAEEAAGGKELRRWGKKDHHWILSWAQSPDDRMVAATYAPESNYGCLLDTQKDECITCLWDRITGKEVRRFLHPEAGMTTTLAFSSNGDVLAASNRKGWIRLWSMKTGRELRCWKAGLDWPRSLVFSPNGKMIAAANGSFSDYTVHLWDAESGREITPAYEGHRGAVASLTFTQDGKEIVSGGRDGVFRVWDATTGVQQQQWAQVNDQASMLPRVSISAVSPDGWTVASAELAGRKNDGGEFMATSLVSLGCRGECRHGKALHFFELSGSQAEFLAFSLNGKIFAYPAAKDWGVNLREATTGKQLQCDLRTKSGAIALSPDGKVLSNCDSDEVVFWDVEKNKKLCTFSAEVDKQKGLVPLCQAFSPDGRKIALGGTDGKIRLWSIFTSKEAVHVGACCQFLAYPQNPNHPEHPLRLAFSPDGGTLAVTMNWRDNSIHLWELTSGRERRRFEGHDATVRSLAFSLDGRRLASGSEDATILVWDVTGRLEQGKLPPARLSADAMESLWAELAGGDAQRAGRAIWTLAAAGSSATAFLEKRLPSKVVAPEVVSRLLADLDADAFLVRQRARQKLVALGEYIVPFLQRALQERPSVEKHRALRQLLELFDKRGFLPAGAELQEVRAVEVLKHIGTPEALQLLQRRILGNAVLK